MKWRCRRALWVVVEDAGCPFPQKVVEGNALVWVEEGWRAVVDEHFRYRLRLIQGLLEGAGDGDGQEGWIAPG